MKQTRWKNFVSVGVVGCETLFLVNLTNMSFAVDNWQVDHWRATRNRYWTNVFKKMAVTKQMRSYVLQCENPQRFLA
jgi:hypothetical protein